MRALSRLSDRAECAREDLGHYFRGRPRRSIGGLFMLGLLVGIGIWAWPELHRTIHIHRM